MMSASDLTAEAARIANTTPLISLPKEAHPMSRLNLIRDAERPKLSARAMFQGPQGSGKTWTMLNVARLLAGDDGTVLMIDTERESALTYADVFRFKHLPWRPPYDPSELTATLDQLARDYGPDDVVTIDSASHFWQGTGGILDIANGRVQGGWDKARPIQNALVDQILAMPCHVLLGARMKNSVLVSDGGKTIENVGLTIIQDDSLGYELNVVVQMDMQHNAIVMKSRTPAVPVGRVYPGGYEKKLAEDYAEWLAGGIPPANREDVERIVAMFAGIADTATRKELKDRFVAEFGMPHSITAEQVPDAYAWLESNGAKVGEGPAASEADETGSGDGAESAQAKPTGGVEGTAGGSGEGGEPPDGTEPQGAPPEATPDAPGPVQPELLPDARPYDPKHPPGEVVEAAIDRATAIADDDLDAALADAGQTVIANHKPDTKRKRLVQVWFRDGWTPEAE